LLAGYPYVEREVIMQALHYPAWRTQDCEVVLAAE